MAVIIKPNKEVFNEISKVLESGGRATLRAKGNSMLPFIVGGRDSIELSPISDKDISCGDILLIKVGIPTRYIVHRVIEVGDDDSITLMGDGNILTKEVCRRQDAIARVTTIIRNNKSIDPLSERELRHAKVWKELLPVRRYILAVYTRTILRGTLRNTRDEKL